MNIRYFTTKDSILIQGESNGYIIEATRWGVKVVNTRTLLAGRTYSTTVVNIPGNRIHTPIRNFMHAWKLVNNPIWLLDHNRKHLPYKEYIEKRAELLAQ